MTLFSKLLAIGAALSVVTSFFLVIFGQITVRKLRRNPETRRALGFEFVSGWDIFHAATALAMPIGLMRKARASRLSWFFADPDLLRAHTNRLDVTLAHLFHWLYSLTGFYLVALVILHAFGVFD